MPLGRMLRRMKLVPVVWIAAVMWLTAVPFRARRGDVRFPLSEVLARVKVSVRHAVRRLSRHVGENRCLAVFARAGARWCRELLAAAFRKELDKQSRSLQAASGTVEQRAEAMAREFPGGDVCCDVCAAVFPRRVGRTPRKFQTPGA